jgi:hypothetical protein
MQFVDVAVLLAIVFFALAVAACIASYGTLHELSSVRRHLEQSEHARYALGDENESLRARLREASDAVCEAAVRATDFEEGLRDARDLIDVALGECPEGDDDGDDGDDDEDADGAELVIRFVAEPQPLRIDWQTWCYAQQGPPPAGRVVDLDTMTPISGPDGSCCFVDEGTGEWRRYVSRNGKYLAGPDGRLLVESGRGRVKFFPFVGSHKEFLEFLSNYNEASAA